MTHPLIDALSPKWTQDKLYQFLQDLSEEELFNQPAPKASSIAWHIWHIARIADILQASFPDREQVWELDNLVETYGLDSSKLGLLQMGVLQSPQDAASVPPKIGKDNLLVYSRDVFDLVEDVFANLVYDDMYIQRESILKIDWDARPRVEGRGQDVLTLNDLEFHNAHSQRHLGMIEALIGVVSERKGTATI
jgi:hypothetical protein